MSEIDRLTARVNPNRRNPTKDELRAFVNESLVQIQQINDEYKKYFDSGGASEGAPSVFGDIEAKIEKIKNTYVTLFEAGDGGESRVAELNKKIEEIKAFHEELLDGDESVETQIETSHEKIEGFYEYLFGKEGEDDGIEPELRETIKTLLQSKKDISAFEIHLNEKIKPSLIEVQKDIKTKQEEVSALLSNATAKTLAQGYAESKGEYSIPVAMPRQDGRRFYNFRAALFNIGGRYIPFLASYALFILPLVGVSLLFISETTAGIVLKSLSRDGVAPSPLELIYVKTLISVPLIWIAWYGQKNLSQRKRLFEEYNHKLRVVQMYIMFTSDAKSYKLTSVKSLEAILLQTIQHNASEVFGSGETMLERLADVIRARKEGTLETTKVALSPFTVDTPKP